MTEPVEVVALPPGLRAFTVLVWAACAGFFAWLAVAHPTQGNWIGYAMGVVALWSALYWLRAPGVVARADDAGITYADMRLGLLFVFGEAQAAWSDVLAVDTRQRSSRYGTYLRTRVTVRAEGGAGRRTFTITSRARGYVRFLDALREKTAGMSVEETGLGDDPVRAAGTLRDLAISRTRVLAGMLAFALLLVAFLFLFRR